MALEPKLHEVKASYDHLIDLSQSEDGESVWEGEDEALNGKEAAERRYQDLLDKLHTKKELLSAELSKYVIMATGFLSLCDHYNISVVCAVPRPSTVRLRTL